MMHILFRIYNRHFAWKQAKSYDHQDNTELFSMVDGMITKKLTSDDFRKLARSMDRAGLKNIRFTVINGEIYICLND